MSKRYWHHSMQIIFSPEKRRSIVINFFFWHNLYNSLLLQMRLQEWKGSIIPWFALENREALILTISKLKLKITLWNRKLEKNKNPKFKLCHYLNNTFRDRFRYLLECCSFNLERKRATDQTFHKRPNIIIFKSLMNISTSNGVKYRKMMCIYKL